MNPWLLFDLGDSSKHSKTIPENLESSSSKSCKLDRKPSLRRKLGALIRGSADLPAAINRGLQPLRRSLSFSKDLNQVYESQPSAHHHHSRTRSAQWYNSLCSLAENDAKDDDNDSTNNDNNNNGNNSEEDDDTQKKLDRLGGRFLERTHSLLEKNVNVSNTILFYDLPYFVISLFIVSFGLFT